MTTHAKLLAQHKELITHLYRCGWSPLEISNELGLTFLQVCRFLDKACIPKAVFFVARDVPKATRARIVQIPSCS